MTEQSRSLRLPFNAKWSVASANYWVTTKNRQAPLIADDLMFACEGTELNPFYLLSIACVKSKYFAVTCDYFACDLGGTIEDQIVNATIRMNSLTEAGQLALNELELKQLDIVYQQMSTFLQNMVDLDKVKPLPEPEPPKPPPPPPEPTEPTKPTPGDDTPTTPDTPSTWRKTLLKISGVLAAIMVVAGIFLPGWASTVMKAVIALMQALGGG